MINPHILSNIIDSQKKYFVDKRSDLVRDSLDSIPIFPGKATIISGIRGCGKCTLLLQMQKRKEYSNVFYMNFEDIRLSGFEPSDFKILLYEIEKREPRAIFFDEIHIHNGWKEFVKELLKVNYEIFITDTNYSLKKLPFVATLELFPFSYREYIQYSKQERSIDSLNRYLKVGGIPKYVRNEGTSILNNILDDILVKDIAARNGIKEINSLRQIAVYLLSNIGKEISANSLVGSFGIKSCATIVDYFNFLKESYLIEMIPQYSPSQMVQSRNPKKIYSIDMGLVNIAANSTISNQRKLENIVLINIRHSFKDIFYIKEKNFDETVFIFPTKTCSIVCVRWEIEEYELWPISSHLSLIAKKENIKELYVVTHSNENELIIDGVNIHIIPAHKYL
jgi:uncharacterized protein